MSRPRLYVNLPVDDLARSVAFFTALGFAFDARFTDDTATCMIVGDDSFVMLLTRRFFQRFTRKLVCDRACTEVILCLSQPDRAAVDAMVARARAAVRESHASVACARPWAPQGDAYNALQSNACISKEVPCN